MPKAKPFPDSPEDEEKTTLESQWEDEASTTVEQGDVADKIRSLGVAAARSAAGTNQTNTGASGVDEPTVDEHQAQISAITPVRDVARLQITQGNDAGQELEVRPGKTYTIGRAIDNDCVLSDIAVSRKHFDLRFEDGAWVIVDRGSGNGTVVNGNLEDNPFMLANGDMIEIGNTIFRFDQPNAASRVNPNRTMDLDSDDDEMSTVAGKPLRAEIVDIVELHQPIGHRGTNSRPKTLPPPTPLRQVRSFDPGSISGHERATPPSQPPPLGFPPPGPPSLQQPASTLPLPQMANRPPPGLPPAYGPGAQMHGDPVTALPNMIPTTLPGQGPPMQRPSPMFGYPQATEIPPHSVHAQMLMIQTQNRRGDASTAHVQPVPFDMAIAAQQRYTQPQLTRRAKLVLVGIGTAVFVAVLMVAIIKSSSSRSRATAAEKTAKKKPDKTVAKIAPAHKPDAPKPMTTGPTPPSNAGTTQAPKAGSVAPVAPAMPQGQAKVAPTPSTPPPSAAPPSAAPPSAAPPSGSPAPTTPTGPKPGATPPTPTTPAPRSEPPKVATQTPSAPTAPPTKIEPAKPEPAKPEPPKAEPPKAEKIAIKEPKKSKSSTKRNARTSSASVSKRTPPPETSSGGESSSGGGGADVDVAKVEANKLYIQGRFGDAAKYLLGQAKKAGGSGGNELKELAGRYSNLARYMSVSTETTPANVPYESLRQALKVDDKLGGEYRGEIEEKVRKVAAKAALVYISKGSLREAHTAIDEASAGGSKDIAKQLLDKAAGKLYQEAIDDLEDNPSSAKTKLKLIIAVTEQSSSWRKKATQKLSEIGG